MVYDQPSLFGGERAVIHRLVWQRNNDIRESHAQRLSCLSRQIVLYFGNLWGKKEGLNITAHAVHKIELTWSTSQAARYVAKRAVSTPMAISANIKLTAWC